MKRKTILLILLCSISLPSIPCDVGFVPYIAGPEQVENNTAIVYTHVFDDYYRNSSTGYTGTEWTLTGQGIIGYGEQIAVNFNGLLPGTYILTAKDKFGGSCYGCLSNTTFTKAISVVSPKPDHKIEIIGTIQSTLYECRTYTFLNYKVSNIGTVPAAANVKIYWTKGSDEFLSSNEVVPTIQPGDFYQVNNTTLNTPCTILSNEEDWTLTLFVDPENLITERNENNNKATAVRKIAKLNGIRPKDEAQIVLTSISDINGNLLWKKGLRPLDSDSFRHGLYIYTYQDGKTITVKKVLRK